MNHEQRHEILNYQKTSPLTVIPKSSRGEALPQLHDVSRLQFLPRFGRSEGFRVDRTEG